MKKDKIAQSLKDIESLSGAEMRQMLFDLREYQIELEKENDELRNNQLEDKLNKLSAHINLAQRISKTGSFEYNIIKDEVIWSDEMFRIFGMQPKSTPLTYEEVNARIHPDDRELHYEQTQKIISTGSYNFKHRLVWDDGTIHTILGIAEMQFDENNNPVVMLGTAQEITDRKFQEDEQLLTTNLITKLNISHDFRYIMSEITSSLQKLSGCEAVGIRLKSGNDYPYYETRGFPSEFIEMENHLCAYDTDGNMLCDDKGNPLIECMCGNIICSRFDITKPFFTTYGSFWSNNTTALLANTTDEDRQARTRNRCNGEGYESVALIPLRAGNNVFGLLQFNDHRTDRFTPDLISHFEHIADTLALSLSQRQTEEDLKINEDRLNFYIDNSPMAVIEWDADFVVTRWTGEAEKIFGWSQEETVGKSIINLEMIYEDDISIVQNTMDKLTCGESKYVVLSNRNYTKDKRIIYCEWYNTILLNSQGKMISVMSQVLDVTERKHASELLQQSESRLRLFIKNAPTAIAMFDNNMRYLVTSNSWLTDYKLGEKNIIGLSHYEVFPEISDEWKAVHQRGLAGEIIKKNEDSFLRIDGTLQWLRWEVRPWYIDGNNIGGMILFTEDITERKKTENDLRKSEEKFRLISQLSPVGIYMTTPEGECQYANECWCKMAGLTLNETMGMGWINGIHPDDREMVFNNWQKMVESRGQWGNEYRFMDKTGKTTWVYGVATSQEDVEGNIIGYIGVNIDITERKLTDDILRVSEERHRTIIQTALSGFWTVDMQGRLIEVNNSYCKMSGYNTQELLSMHINDVELIENEKDTKAHIEKVIENGSDRFESRHRRKDGTVFDVEVSAQYQPDNKKIVAFLRDRTERKKNELSLRESEEFLKKIFTTVPDPITIVRITDNICIQVNDGFTNLLGWEKEEIVGKTHHDLNLWVDRNARIKMIEILTRDGHVDNIEANFRCKDGRIITGLFSAKLLTINGIPCLLSVTRDITERKQAEEALRESEEKYRGLIEATSTGFLILDKDGKVIDANKYYIALTGHDNIEDIYGHRVDEWTAPYDIERNHQEIQKCMTQGFVKNLEIDYISKNGKVTPVEINARIVGKGDTVKIMSLCRDITQRRQASNRIEKISKHYQALIENAPDGVVLLNDKMEFTFISPSAERIFGYSGLNDLTGNLNDYTHPDDFKIILPELQKLLDDPTYIPILQYRFLDKNGEWKWIESTFSNQLSDPNVESIVINFRDIDDRKHIEEVQAFLAKTSSGDTGESFFNLLTRFLADNLGMDYICIDRLENDGLFAQTVSVWSNGVFEDNVRYTLKDTPCGDVAGKNICIFPDSVCQLFPQDEVLKVLKAESYAGVTIWDHNGRPTGLIAIISSKPMVNHSLIETILKLVAIRAAAEMQRLDAEEEKTKLEAQLQQSQKMESVGRLAGGVAHDFNNMLGVIIGHAEMALEYADGDQSINASLVEIRKAAEHSADLTRQLLAYARKQTVVPKIVNLNEALPGMLKMLERLIGEDIDLIWCPGKELWQIKMDPSQIDQILTNLCVNARNAITTNGKIVIETRNIEFDIDYCIANTRYFPGEYVRITFTDNGCGMEEAVLKNIFEPFFTTRGVGEGTGLGLATVYGAIKQNNGFITVDSEPGVGTTFNIYIPRYINKSEQSVNEKTTPPVKRGQETILLVEDEEAILKLIRAMLERLGYNVLTAIAPGEAIRIAENYNGPIHLLISDVVMPEMNGRDLAKNLLSIYPHIKRIFMSGYTADVIASHGILDDGIYFIQKPFTIKDIAARVRCVLDE